MEIRCPKCRYRFEEEIPPYSSEHQCFCPRCGTPFLYTPPASEGQDESIETPQQRASSAATNTSSSASGSDFRVKGDAPRSPEGGGTRVGMQPSGRTAGFRSTHGSSHRRQRANRNSGNKWLLAILLMVMAALVAGIVFVGYLLNSRASVQLQPDESVSGVESEEVIDSLDEMFYDDEEVPVQPAPQWVQGKWTARTEYNDIVVLIRGNNITEIDGAYRLNGTFVCKGQKLVCDYGKGNIFTYHLNSSARTIDCGKGIVMRKEE